MDWGFDAQSFHYKGFFIRWTGWKTTHDNNLYYAQWTAYDFNQDPKGKGWTQHIYSSIPGALDFYTLGGTFDISCRGSQHLVTLDNRDSPETMAMKDRALDLLLERVREVRLGEEQALYYPKKEDAIHPIGISPEPIRWSRNVAISNFDRYIEKIETNC